jgi:hypothetical protein
MIQRSILPLAAALLLTAGGAGMARAVEFDVGPGGVYVGHRHPYGDYRAYDRYERCRVIIDHRVNRFGDRVTVRRRICD